MHSSKDVKVKVKMKVILLIVSFALEFRVDFCGISPTVRSAMSAAIQHGFNMDRECDR